jgi:hypothetical protein
MIRRLLLGVILWLAGSGPAVAQDTVFLSLTADATVVQTGQIYEAQVMVENVTDLWVAEFEITFDADQVYVFGTAAGSPMKPGPLLAGEIIAPRNRIVNNMLEYTVSLIAPAEPINGTGTLATFQIYPLRAGDIQFSFRRASLMQVSFQQTAEGRVPGEPQALTFTPVLLQLTAAGEAVPVPDEMTATPPPTLTPIAESLGTTPVATITAEPTLVNVTRAPATPTIAVPEALPSTTNPALIVALVFVIMTGISLLILLVIYLRRYRR